MHPSFGNSVLAFFSMTVKGSSVKPTISQKEWEDLAARMEAYGAWLEAKPNEGVCSLGKRFGEGEFTAATVETLRQLIQKDLAMAKKAESLKELRSLNLPETRFFENFGNFVSLDDFYVRKRGLFRSGRYSLTAGSWSYA